VNAAPYGVTCLVSRPSHGGSCAFGPVPYDCRPQHIVIAYRCAKHKRTYDMPIAKPRPKYLNLFQIRQPIPAIVSIMHRISGAVLFLFLWLFLAGLDRSLMSEAEFGEVKSLLAHPLMKLLMLALLWAYLHHTFAGIRHLAIDLHIGVELPKVRAMSYAALFLAIGVTLIVGVILW
jgi:succinate dehydrogenase / fumarate reductase cytochrome b subunit